MNAKRIGLISILVAGLMLQLLSPVSSAYANVRTEEAGNLPYYARTDPPFSHTDEWAIIVFYRPPECIPADFNLLDLFDIPGAFACGSYTTDGFAIWKNGPGIDDAPIQQKLFGLGAVPVWFVPWPDLQNAIEDGILTIGDLQDMSPLNGSASFYEETLHPSKMIEFTARGILENDGRNFSVHVTTVVGGADVTNIVFR
jgi:hypothetical protein